MKMQPKLTSTGKRAFKKTFTKRLKNKHLFKMNFCVLKKTKLILIRID